MNHWNLSPAESQVLGLLAERAATCKEVGKQLGKSNRTVEKQVCSAMKKMGARSQLQAVLMFDRMRQADALSREQAMATGAEYARRRRFEGNTSSAVQCAFFAGAMWAHGEDIVPQDAQEAA